MRSFLLMISFFTRLPLGKRVTYSAERFVRGLVFFPLVGLITGVILWGVGQLLHLLTIPPMLMAFLLLLVYFYTSGCIHLDGLSDSADGLYSGQSKERMLEIMKDSRVGSFGVIAIVMVLIGYLMGLYYLDLYSLYLLLLLFPFAGKVYAYWLGAFSNYARTQGMGDLFMRHSSKGFAVAYVAVLILIFYIIFGLFGLWVLVVPTLWTGFHYFRCKRMIGGQTGDTIGMAIEMTQVLMLLSMVGWEAIL